MTTLDRLSIPAYPGEDSLFTRQHVSMGAFIKDAWDTLNRVAVSSKEPHQDDISESDAEPEPEAYNPPVLWTDPGTDSWADDDDDTNSLLCDDAVTWKLNLSPSMMTLDTNIQTLAGLKKVLEQLSVNFQPHPQRTPLPISSDRFKITAFQHSMLAVLRLSLSVRLPTATTFQHLNSVALMQQCVNAFITYEGALFMDPQRLLADTRQVLSCPEAAKDMPIETLLILSICCLMIRHVAHHNSIPPAVAVALMHGYYQQARRILQEVFDVYHISVVQAMFLLSLFPRGHVDLYSSSRIQSPLLQSALRMALAIDIHTMDACSSVESESKERTRRFAWMLLCADYFAEFNATGATGWIAANEWQVNFPAPMKEEAAFDRVKCFSTYCRVVMLRKMHLFRSAYMLTFQSPKEMALELDRQIFSVFHPLAAEQTPQGRETAYCMDWTRSDLNTLLLYALYAGSSLTARLPFLPRQFLACLSKETHVQPPPPPQEEDEDEEDEDERGDMHGVSSYSLSSGLTPCRSSPTFPPTCASIRHLIETSPNIAFYCVMSCLEIAHMYTALLEALALMDTTGCHHSPVYGLLITSFVYRMLLTGSQDGNVKDVCHVNLNRTLALVGRVKSVYHDSVLLYLEKIIPQWTVVVQAPEEMWVVRADQKMALLKAQVSLWSVDKSKGGRSDERGDEGEACQTLDSISENF
ncbi:hypothetical protein BDF14DRAFT_1867382 [Spinellus fusiger]|nr:hypothetical protein BDF14DRAFT_1867382 [Spinellus fusiger]